MLVPRSRWVRRRYYSEDGLLKPIPGSAAESYDPFAADPPPYHELAGLDTSDERALETFVTRFGVLGLFQERLHKSQDQMQAIAEDQGLNEMPEVYRRPVPAECYDYLPAIRSAPVGAGDREEAFSRLQEIIYGDEVWDYLAEPVAEFQAAADEFRAAYLLAVAGPDGQKTAAEAEQLRHRFAGHLRRVRPEADFSVADDGATVAGWSLTWTFPSLLSACYQQLLLELVGGQDLRICKNERCDKPFTARHKKHFYCCDACGNAQEQRERRRDPDRKLKRLQKQEQERQTAA